jgi:hypothetical protein
MKDHQPCQHSIRDYAAAIVFGAVSGQTMLEAHPLRSGPDVESASGLTNTHTHSPQEGSAKPENSEALVRRQDTPRSEEEHDSFEALELHLLTCQECCDQLEREINLQRVLREHSSAVVSALAQRQFGLPIRLLSGVQLSREQVRRRLGIQWWQISLVRLWATAATVAAATLLVIVVSSPHLAGKSHTAVRILPYVQPYAARGDEIPALLVVKPETTEVLIVATPPEDVPRDRRIAVEVIGPGGAILVRAEIDPNDMGHHSIFVTVTVPGGFLPGKYLLRFQGEDKKTPAGSHEYPFFVSRQN